MRKILPLLIAAVCCLMSPACTHANNGITIPLPTPTPSGNQDKEEKPEQKPDAGTVTAPLDNDAVKRTMHMGLGWNLGNNLDAYEEDPDSKNYLMPDETIWGNPKATQQALTKVRQAGFTTIRIPVTWLAKIGPAPDYIIDAEWMARVTEVVNYARTAGFETVIVDTHHDEDHDDNHWQSLKKASKDAAVNAQIKEEITKVWTQIANIFKDCGGRGVAGPEHHYYFRHDTGEYYPDAKEAIDVLLRGWFNDDESYTLQSVYNSAPVF